MSKVKRCQQPDVYALICFFSDQVLWKTGFCPGLLPGNRRMLKLFNNTIGDQSVHINLFRCFIHNYKFNCEGIFTMNYKHCGTDK